MNTKNTNMVGMYKSELSAKRRARRNEGYCIVEFCNDGKYSYDYFPAGHVIGYCDDNGQFVKATNHTIICRAYRTASGKIVWR